MSTNQSWGGRFAEGPREAVAAYTDSQTYDRALYAQDIRASQAHARMLGRQGIITPQEAETLVRGLDAVKKEIEDGSFIWKPALEDVHMNIEARLTELVGDTGKKLHTGRSRNDQVGLTFRLFVNDRLADWQHAAQQLVATLVRLADGHQADILPGCTHLQPAQPVSLAHHLLAYAWMFARDTDRLDDVRKRVRVSPLGCAALAGTTYPLDPESVAREVGFERIYGNSMDGVSDRDFVLESLFAASCIMAHLSRLCEEIILWANPAFGFVSLSDGYSTGSSIMPQKKNPDVAELMRGKTGRVYGALMGLLTTVKGLPLTYNRDLQEDKEGFLDTDRTVTASLTNHQDTLLVNTDDGAVYASTDGIGWSRREALSGQVVSLLASFPSNQTSATPATLNAIVKDAADGKSYFATTNSTLSAWTLGEEVPEGFPSAPYTACMSLTSNGLNKAFLVGSGEEGSEQTVPWSSMLGTGWVDLSTTSDTHCPALSHPYIMYYGDALYIFGGQLESFYKSATGGIAWEKPEEKFLFPAEFALKGTSYTATVDQNNYIWIVWGGAGHEVWRGCLNQLKKY